MHWIFLGEYFDYVYAMQWLLQWVCEYFTYFLCFYNDMRRHCMWVDDHHTCYHIKLSFAGNERFKWRGSNYIIIIKHDGLINIVSFTLLRLIDSQLGFSFIFFIYFFFLISFCRITRFCEISKNGLFMFVNNMVLLPSLLRLNFYIRWVW